MRLTQVICNSLSQVTSHDAIPAAVRAAVVLTNYDERRRRREQDSSAAPSKTKHNSAHNANRHTDCWKQTTAVEFSAALSTQHFNAILTSHIPLLLMAVL